MHKIKKIICGLLIFCMIFTGIMTEPKTIKASSKKSGNYGQIHWEFKNNTLILSAVKGTKGKLKYHYSHATPDGSYISIRPWDKLKSVKKVIVEDGVTELEEDAFIPMGWNLDSVVIAGTVKKIKAVSSWSTTIKNVYLKNGVNNIEKYAFYNVQNVFIPKTVKNISHLAFSRPYPEAGGGTTFLKKVYGYDSANYFVDKLITLIEETRDNIRLDEDDCITSTDKHLKFLSLTESSTLSKAKVTSSLTLNKGENQLLKVTLPAGFINVKKYTGNPADVKVTYKSSDSSVAVVSSGGKVTGNKSGTAKITVTMQIKDGAKKTLTTKVTVK